MESKNLNDIVIEDSDNSKKAQLKNILTLLALLFIILVISIVITKLILGDEESTDPTHIGVTTKDVKSGTSATTNEESSNGEAVALAAAAATTAALATAANSSDDKAKESDSKAEEAKKTVLIERNTTSRKKLTLRDHRAKKIVVKERPKKKSRDRYVAPKKRPKAPAKKAVPAKTVKNATRGYYIQVGSFKDPTHAIKLIKANKLKYKETDTSDGMLTRVLVGPYYSQKDAQNDLGKVKSKIAAGAFIKKVK
jgi:DedD protein